MRKLIIGALVGVVAVIATGCTGDGNSERPQASPTPPVEEVYVTVLHEVVPGTKNVSDAKLVELGRETCNYFDEAGVSPASVLAYGDALVEGSGGVLTVGDAGSIMGAATSAFCPESYDRIMRVIQ